MTAPLNQFPGAPDSSSGSSPPPAHGLGWAAVTDFVRRHWGWLLSIPLVAIVATLLVSRLIPAKYEASATLLVSQLELETSIEGKPLPLHGLQWILESPIVLEAAERRVEQATDGREVRFEVGKNVESQMLVRRREESALAPMIGVTTRADSAELAILMANAWTEAFVEHLGQLRQNELGAVVEAMEKALTEAEERVRDLETARSDNRETFEQSRAKLAGRWRERLTGTVAVKEERLNAFRTQARQRLGGVLETFRETIDALALAQRQAFEIVLAERRRLAELPDRLVLVSHDVPDRIVVSSERAAPAPESSMSFFEQVNPAYLDLAGSVANAEERLLRSAAEGSLSGLLAELAAAQQSLSAQRTSFEYTRFADLQLEERRRLLEEESLVREFEVVDGQLDRELEQALRYREEVATRHREALVSARAQSDLVPIRMASEAVTPRAPLGQHLPMRVAIAGLIGLGLAIGFALIRDRC